MIIMYCEPNYLFDVTMGITDPEISFDNHYCHDGSMECFIYVGF